MKDSVHFCLGFEIEVTNCCLSRNFRCSLVSEQELHTLSGACLFVCFLVYFGGLVFLFVRLVDVFLDGGKVTFKN